MLLWHKFSSIVRVMNTCTQYCITQHQLCRAMRKNVIIYTAVQLPCNYSERHCRSEHSGLSSHVLARAVSHADICMVSCAHVSCHVRHCTASHTYVHYCA